MDRPALVHRHFRAGREAGRFAFMKKFSFSLQSVLRIREHEEQLVQLELAAALRDRVEVAGRLQTHKDAERDLHSYMRSNQLNASELHHIARYDALHRQRIVDITVELAHMDEAVENIRQRLAVAHTRTQALHKLRARQEREHQTAFEKWEAAQLDEVGIQRALRARQELAAA